MQTEQVQDVMKKFEEAHPGAINPPEIKIPEGLTIGAIGQKGKIYITQGKNVLVYGLSPNQARHLALALRRVANQVEQEANTKKKNRK
jgi:hypothetical protein